MRVETFYARKIKKQGKVGDYLVVRKVDYDKVVKENALLQMKIDIQNEKISILDKEIAELIRQGQA